MSDLRKAAEAVLERWDTPAWEWMKQGPTAELMAALRAALAAPSEDIEALRRENERLQNLLYDQMGEMFALRAAEQMRKQIAELKHAENGRLRGLLAEAQKAVWMNYDGDLLDRIEAALKEVPR